MVNKQGKGCGKEMGEGGEDAHSGKIAPLCKQNQLPW